VDFDDTPELQRLRREYTLGCLWTFILSLLAKRRRYAYTLRAEIAREFGFTPGLITVYKVLYLLQGRGYLTIESKTIAGRERKYYTITRKGRALLRAGLREIARITRMLA